MSAGILDNVVKRWIKIFRAGLFSGSPESLTFMENNTPIGRYARILLDDWFKRSFGTEPYKRLLELFLKELIPEHNIVELTYVSQEHVNPFPGKKSVRVDVECLDADGSRFIVELQVAPQESFYDRAVLYSTFAVQQQINRSSTEDYFFPTVYFIGLMDFSFHEDSDQVLYRYELREKDTGETMTPHLQYIFLELTNCHKALTPEATVLDNFCYVLHNMEHLTDRPEELKQEVFKYLFESAEIAKFTPQEKTKYIFDMTTERDRRNQLAYAQKKALEQGMEKGMEKGRAQEREESARRIARSLKELGVSSEIILQSTGLTAEELAGL